MISPTTLQPLVDLDHRPLGVDLSGFPVQEMAAIEECSDWLHFHRLWGQLTDVARHELARSLHLLKAEKGTVIYREGDACLGLYLLKWGAVEIYRNSPIGQTLIRQRSAGELFGYVSLLAGTTSAKHQTQAIALTVGEIWFLPQDRLQEILHQYTDVEHLFNSLLAQDLNSFSARIAWEQQRIQGLRDYICAAPRGESVLGSSKFSRKLELMVDQAAGLLQPVGLQGAKGSGKTFVAGLIHSRSTLAEQPFVELDCASLPLTANGSVDTDILFGRFGQQAGLIELLERGTLFLENFQVLSEIDRNRIATYCATRNIQLNTAPDVPPKIVQSRTRIIFASPEALRLLNVESLPIKLFSLSQRKADIPDFINYFLGKFCQTQNRPQLILDQTELRRLISYAYPGNIKELAAILSRAVIMAPVGQTIIPEQALWSVQSAKNAFRVDLLTQIPWLRSLLLSNWYPESLWVVMMALFIPVTIAGLFGPQTRDSSVTLNFFWAWWWPGYLLLFVFIGRLWCAVCPFMITAEWLRRVSLWLFPRKQLLWPTQWLNRWGAWILFGGFVVIYLWEKLWDLPNNAALSAWLLLAITAGAVICSLIFERRLWCRYLCPIGGMNGMFAKLAVVELRSAQQVCGSQCSTFGCFKGSGATPVTFADALPSEGQATGGCPLYSHPAQLQDNRDCVLCMTCLKACPNRSVQLNLRFPSSDLLEKHQGFWAEVALLWLLLGGVLMHHSERILTALGYPSLPVDSSHIWSSAAIALVLLSIPPLATYLTHAIARRIDPGQPIYLTAIYAYLPLTLALNLAHYVPAAMTEAGKILPVLARTLGYSGVGLPTLTWSADVATFMQGVTLLAGLVFSIYPLLRITQRTLLSNLPHLGLMAGLTVAGFWLFN